MIDPSAIGAWARLWKQSVTWFVLFFYWLILLGISGYSYSIMLEPGSAWIIYVLGVVPILIWAAALLYLARNSGNERAAPQMGKFAACTMLAALGNVLPYVLLQVLLVVVWTPTIPYFPLLMALLAILIAAALFPLEVRMVAAATGDREVRFGHIARFLREQRGALFFTYILLFACIVGLQHIVGIVNGAEVTGIEFAFQQLVVAFRSIGAILFMIVTYRAVASATVDLAEAFD